MYPLLKAAVPLPKLERFERYLFIGPHPDDIEVACAPTVKKLCSTGKHVDFLVLTDGRMGSRDPALFGEPLVAVRQAEACASAELLGANEPAFLPFADGGLYAVEDAAIAIAREIVRCKPDAVFAPDPDVSSECHADHIKTGLAVKMAMNMAPFFSIMSTLGESENHAVKALALYGSDRPNARVHVGRFFSSRAAALACHKSQFDEASIRQIVLYFTLRSLRIGRYMSKCDGYRVFAPVHMHCFPEAARW